MTNRFTVRKQTILKQLEVPDGDYTDLSPKGSVDEPIRGLISEINALDGLVTTSSCSGRISVFLEGRKAAAAADDISAEEAGESRAGPGGKGGGGAWLFISHSPIEESQLNSTEPLMSRFGLEDTVLEDAPAPSARSRCIHLKFEPMILHILTASTDDAQRALTAALSAGFRESGAVSLGAVKGSSEATPMVAVRSTGYSFDSIIGYQDEAGRNLSLVNERYLRTLVAIANDRFKINTERIARFREALMEAFQRPTGTSSKPDWEDADARKRRKREEGLARQLAMQATIDAKGTSPSGIEEGDLASGILDGR